MDSAPISFRPRVPSAVVPPADGPSVVLSVEGMTCNHCALRVQEALQGVPGVEGVRVDLAAATASVRRSIRGEPADALLVGALQKAGYAARIRSAAGVDAAGPRLKPWTRALFLGAPVTLALMVAEWGLGLGMHRTYQWIALVLTLPVQVLVGAQFYQGAWWQLRSGRSNMDTLVSIGSTAAFGFSAWALVVGFPGHVYFMESAGILTLISLGHWLEARMASRAGDALRSLLQLTPERARRWHGGREHEVAVGDLVPGDLILLKPGDRIPVDAEVTEGTSSVVEAMLTGEAIPIAKVHGAALYAGTVNQTGRLLAQVRATGRATALSRIIAAVERAQSSRADIQRLADRISSVFVPVVVIVAILTAFAWALAYPQMSAVHASIAGGLWHSMVPESPVAAAFVMATAVLIVACPCAMGLATPTALMAGVNAAARRGILIRDAQALEKSGRVSMVLFDKTGTLTVGAPGVVDVWSASVSLEDLRPRIAGLTRFSQHPLSRAVAAWAGDGIAAEVPSGGWIEHRGLGVEAQAPGRSGSTSVHRLGSLDWLQASGVDLGPAAESLGHWQREGCSVLGVAEGASLLGAFAVRDPLRDDAVATLQRLRQMGVRVGLMTGDRMEVARELGRQLDLSPEWISAGVRPEGKAEAIREWQARGERVCFVGDGLNDGPALAQADLGIAVMRATDVAKEAADLLLLSPDLAAVPRALEVSQATLRVIRQNLFWAFFYNAAFVPLAALGFLSPMLSAVAMAASDLIVIGNALRLRRR
ncbi:MAG: heavy metal translocating P-type ATPase [Verrucomicrobiota bacterium]